MKCPYRKNTECIDFSSDTLKSNCAECEWYDGPRESNGCFGRSVAIATIVILIIILL